MQRPVLQTEIRQLIGKKVKNLRSRGFLPGHIYGHGLDSISVSLNQKTFSKLYNQVGETGLIDIVINSEKPRPVLIQNVQMHPVSNHLLHVDFYQVNLTEKVKVTVALEITGEAPAVEQKIGLLLTPASEVEIEALPENLPENIQVDVSKLEQVGDSILVKDLIAPAGVEILSDPELVVVNVGELISREAEEEMAAEEAAKEAEAEAATEAGLEQEEQIGPSGPQPSEPEESRQE